MWFVKKLNQNVLSVISVWFSYFRYSRQVCFLSRLASRALPKFQVQSTLTLIDMSPKSPPKGQIEIQKVKAHDRLKFRNSDWNLESSRQIEIQKKIFERSWFYVVVLFRKCRIQDAVAEFKDAVQFKVKIPFKVRSENDPKMTDWIKWGDYIPTNQISLKKSPRTRVREQKNFVREQKNF